MTQYNRCINKEFIIKSLSRFIEQILQNKEMRIENVKFYPETGSGPVYQLC